MQATNEKFYDTGAETKVSGTIRATALQQNSQAHDIVSLMIASDGVEHHIILGPQWFVERQSLPIIPNQSIDVIGSVVNSKGSPCILAREVIFVNQKFFLRDPSGQPLWNLCSLSIF